MEAGDHTSSLPFHFQEPSKILSCPPPNPKFTVPPPPRVLLQALAENVALAVMVSPGAYVDLFSVAAKFVA